MTVCEREGAAQQGIGGLRLGDLQASCGPLTNAKAGVVSATHFMVQAVNGEVVAQFTHLAARSRCVVTKCVRPLTIGLAFVPLPKDLQRLVGACKECCRLMAIEAKCTVANGVGSSYAVAHLDITKAPGN